MFKRKILFTIIFIAQFLVSNTQEKGIENEKSIESFNTKVLYELSFKKNTTSKNVTNLETILFINAKKESFFTFKSMISLDSIQSKREIELKDIKKYNTHINFVIKKKESSFAHYEKIGLDILTFSEEITHNWLLKKDTKIINGYNCSKATVNLGGRSWTAWYTLDIPIDSGPYKFYGLPGLILEVYDNENIFKFEAIKVSRKKFEVNTYPSNYFITDNKEQQKTTKPDFLKLRNKFYSLDVSGRLNYINRNKDDNGTIVITDTNEDKIRSNSKTKKRNFIEKIDK